MGAGIPQVITETKASGAQVIDGSLKIESSKSQFLSRLPGSSGNRKTWTWSCWVKKPQDEGFSDDGVLFEARLDSPGSSDPNIFGIRWLTTGPIGVYDTGTFYISGTREFRDTSAWYHLVLSVDTTQASNNLSLYVNGDLYLQGSYAQNTDTRVNDTCTHRIGARTTLGSQDAHFLSSQLAQTYFIDGQALGPEYFGFTDGLTNTWRPKKLNITTESLQPITTAPTLSNGALIIKAKGDSIGGLFESSSGSLNYHSSSDGISWTRQSGGLSHVMPAAKYLAAGGSGTNNRTFTPDGTPNEGYEYALWNTNTNFDVGSNPSNTDVTSLTYIDRPGLGVFGTNGFYLPMDGNSPIGEDKSGTGNNWTPVNFGGSVALDNPQVSGARPILNTDGGGNVARPGVFGSEENQFVTVTVASKTGGGNAYFFGGVERDSLASLRGTTVTFNTTDSTNNTHPFKLSSTNADSSGGTEYTDGVAYYINGSVTTGSDYVTNYSTGAASGFRGIKWTVPHNVSTTYYYCTVHNGMGENGRLTSTTDETKADPYAWKNVLALPLVGSKDDISNSVNSGSTAKAITAYGNAAASSAQSNFYGGSYYFDGTGDYLTTVSSTDFGFGTGDFTLEYYLYPTSLSSTYHPNFTVGTTGGIWVGKLSSNFSVHTMNDTILLNYSTLPTLNKWTHIVVSRSGTTLRLFYDGVQVASTTTSYNFASGVAYISNDTSTNYTTGYMQDIRVYNGVAKYTSDFVVASTNPDILPDTPSGVSGSSKLAKVTDGAVSFDGSGDYLSIADSSDLTVGTNPFTLEFYAYKTAAGEDFICGSYDSSGTTASLSYAVQTGGSSPTNSLVAHVASGGSATSVNSGVDFVLNKWVHVAFVRDGNTLRLFQDGIQMSTAAFSATVNDASNAFEIGRAGFSGKDFPGFISNFRFVNGTALYTTDFTPPTRELTNVTNTKLLCCQSNTLAGSAAVSPNISGTNDGTVWSRNYTSTSGFNASYPPSYAFNGSVSNYAEPVDTGSTMTVTFNPPLVVSGDFDVKISSTGELFTTINGGASTSKGSGLNQYHTLGSNITVSNFTYTSSTRPVLYSVRINGSTILVDPVTANGNASATTFNPFNTDINTVRGQETGYPTWNPIYPSDITLSNGNLKVTRPSGSDRATLSTLGVSSGKYYWETTINLINYHYLGVAEDNHPPSNYGGQSGSNSAAIEVYGNGYIDVYNGEIATGGSAQATGTLSGTPVIGLALDLDSNPKTLKYYNNGTLISALTKTITSTNTLFPLHAIYTAGSNNEAVYNFGQKPFKYAPPDGFQSLNAANVRPETVIARPDHYVGVTTYTGNGSVQNINVGLKPDFVWIKNRDTTDSHVLFDTIRGVERTLYSNLTNNDSYNAGSLTSFDSDGFTLGSYANANQNTSGLVAWSWKAGGNKNTFNKDDVGYASAAAAGLTGGDITPVASSVGTKQGFSIIQYQGNGSTDQTIPHGLTQAPDFSIIKNMDGVANWTVFHRSATTTTQKVFYLNTTGAIADYSGGDSTWWGTLPGASVFTIGATSTAINNGTNDMISYHWHDVPGLQKFGSYVGNGDNDGAYIELGFAPKILLTKSSSHGSDWQLWDTSRQPYNTNANTLAPNTTGVESDTSGYKVDMLSNGVKFRMYGSSSNQSGYTYIYAAWAEAPTFNLFGAQSNAR